MRFKIKKRTRRILAGIRAFRLLPRIKGRGRLLLGSRSHVHIANGAVINLAGSLFLGSSYRGSTGRSSVLTLEKGSRLVVDGDFDFYYDADIQLFEGATLTLGSGFINSGCKIRCHESIDIGDGCAISHDFTVMDSNAHMLNGLRGTAPVVIGRHVWIGTRVTVLSGVTIGDGAVVAAGALVAKDVPAGSLVGGVPARVISERVEWEK